MSQQKEKQKMMTVSGWFASFWASDTPELFKKDPNTD